jgi:succinylglutamate desuccinylase
MKSKKTIIIRKNKNPGKTLAIFAGIHGNESVGVLALDLLLPQLTIEAGTVYFVYGNPKAIKLGVRKTAKDLNRSFLPENTLDTYEDRRARTLMKILDQSDALLDLHAFAFDAGHPFIICEKDSFDLASRMDFPFVTSGWDRFDIGSSDGYMRSLKKEALCLELGSTTQAKEYIPLAIQSIKQFLAYHGAISGDGVVYNKRKQKYLRIKKRLLKKTNEFKFMKNYGTCDRLIPQKPYAQDKSHTYKALPGEYILFANETVSIGDETCLIAQEK